MKAFVLLILLTFFLTACSRRVVVRQPNVRTVKVLPKKHRVVVVKGNRYYYWNGRHYRKTRRGYVFVKM